MSLNKRHIRTDAACRQHDGGIEDTIHALRDYFVVNRIWRELIPSSSDYGNFFSIPVREWLFQNLNNNIRLEIVNGLAYLV